MLFSWRWAYAARFPARSALLCLFFALRGFSAAGQAHPVRAYTLTIRAGRIDKGGGPAEAITVNDSIPAPTLFFTEGDSAVIHIRNEMKEVSSVHWHGILLPNAYDGVPYLTAPPIAPHHTYTVRFVVRQHGTYWYHSHSMMQEQRGLYGAIVIRPRRETVQADTEVVVLFSDWTHENPRRILRNLKRNSAWYQLKKGQAQSLDRVIAHHGLRERLSMAWQRMPPMDVSDVYYDAFLAGGERLLRFPGLRPGETVRLRVINGSSSTFFHYQFAGGPLRLIAADGMDVKPTEVSRMLVGIAETYDFLITVPKEGAWEFRATAQDGSGHASVWIGRGPLHAAPDLPSPDIYHLAGLQMGGMRMGGMKISPRLERAEAPYLAKDTLEREDIDVAGSLAAGGMEMTGAHRMPMPPDAMPAPAPDNARAAKEGKTRHAGMPGMEMSMPGMDHDRRHPPQDGRSVADHPAGPFTYDSLRALHPTSLDTSGHPVRRLTFRLTGSMWRYQWSINGKALSAADSILVHQGEILRIRMVNETMMYHPMHLHGHFFRVMNARGAYSPLKHTVIVPPMRTVTIELLANEPGDWFFHCHVLYHMMTGMGRVFRYAGYRPPDSAQAYQPSMFYMDERRYTGWGSLSAATNEAQGDWSWSNPKNVFALSGDYGWKEGWYEAQASYAYFVRPYLRPYAGMVSANKPEYLRYFGKHGRRVPDADVRAVAGIRYLLPFFLNLDMRIDSRAHLRVSLDGETWLFPRIWLRYGVNTDREFYVTAEGMLSERFSLTAGYHSDYRWGGGVMVRF